MKKIVFVFLALAILLTACGSPAPVTSVVIPTDEPAAATDMPMDTDEPGQPTETTTPAAPAETAEPGAAPTDTKSPAIGADMFIELRRTSDIFSLRCSPDKIVFTLVSVNPLITGVDFYYRVVDKDSSMAPGALIRGGEMIGDDKGNFTLEFSALDVEDDMRTANGWFDYQFIGLNKFGDPVGRTDKIVQQVTYTIDCP